MTPQQLDPPAESNDVVREPTIGRWNDVQEAALSLLSERGYHGTTMKQVAALLGVQAPSLYNHVGSKQEMLARIMTAGMERLTKAQEAALAGSENVADQLRAMTQAHVLLHIRYQRSAMIGDRELRHLEEPTQSQVRAQRGAYELRFRSVIEQGIGAGLFHVRSSKLASFAIIEMATSVAVWFKENGPMTADEVADQYGEMALRIAGFRNGG